MTNTWSEADHPRDEEGKFTYKNGGASGNSSNNSMRREDILYPTMKDKNPKVNYNNVGLGNYNNEKLSGEDILYPTMSNKKTYGVLTGGAASLHQTNKEYIENLKEIVQTDSDKKFLNCLTHILDVEKGYNNIKGDKPTNLGVTQYIYNVYREDNNLPKQDVKKINIKEATQIYYKYFWKPSGADKLQHPLDLVYFDMYINSNPTKTKSLLKQSNYDVNMFIKNRRNFYNNLADTKKEKAQFKNGWKNRMDILEKYVKDYNSNLK